MSPQVAPPQPAKAGELACFHCGTPCGEVVVRREEKAFCCQGCATVFELLAESGLGHFYDLGKQAGIRVKAAAREDQFKHLDDPAVGERLLDFSDGKASRVTFRVPAIHCVACVWLLENLFRLNPAIGESRVNFPKREVAITFDSAKLKLSGLVALLSSLGYEPVFNLADLGERTASPVPRGLWLQIGIAGFAFGNVMMLSFPSYLGLEGGSSRGMQLFFGVVSLALSLPVATYCASHYWRAAWLCVRQRMLTIELPIAAGLVALFTQSAWEIFTGAGPGYCDSLCGLIFFLLCGRLFQQKTYDRLSFDRDYTSFFPLSVVRLRTPSSGTGSAGTGGTRTRDEDESVEETVALARLRVGDRLLLRHGELIPADARLVSGEGIVDYSFVTGESEPVVRKPGDYLYAGGQQTGAAIEVEIVKPVSQSYLTSLWSHAAFAKERTESLNTITNRQGRRFTIAVALVAVATAVYWSLHDPGLTWKTFTAVLIVACPCALALASPFALGTGQRWLARRNIFLKNPQVLETLARVDTIVFDKTGTLTEARAGGVSFVGEPLSAEEAAQVWALARHSTHPLARRIGDFVGQASSLSLTASEQSPVVSEQQPRRGRTGGPNGKEDADRLEACPTGVAASLPRAILELFHFREHAGRGIEGRVLGKALCLGSAAWLKSRGVNVPEAAGGSSVVHLAVGGVHRGHFKVGSALRPQTEDLIGELSARYELALLSGDNERERETVRELFGQQAKLRFNESPLGKLDFIRNLQRAPVAADVGPLESRKEPGGLASAATRAKTVMMVGDGLNDAGALRQSDVGVAVVEQVGAFSPASDVILEASMVPQLPALLRFARLCVGVVYASFGLSIAYNVVGITLAARGLFSPLVSAILMPLSSVTVVAFACGATTWAAKRNRLLNGRMIEEVR